MALPAPTIEEINRHLIEVSTPNELPPPVFAYWESRDDRVESTAICPLNPEAFWAMTCSNEEFERRWTPQELLD